MRSGVKMPIYTNWGGGTPPEIRGDVTAADHHRLD
jgi:hypothetical protein